jgi:hypothetical protein
MGAPAVSEALAKEGITVSKSAIGAWATQARRAASARRPAPPRRRPATAPASARPEVQRPNPAEPAEDGSGAEELEGIDPTSLDVAELLELDRRTGRLLRKSFKEKDQRSFLSLAKFRLDLRKAICRLRPPPKIDPMNDPASLEAREAVLAKIRKMIENAEARSVSASGAR